jgi:hypothetical protein
MKVKKDYAWIVKNSNTGEWIEILPTREIARKFIKRKKIKNKIPMISKCLIKEIL